MRAMILAAGRGGRLKPLTDTCPKPLIPVLGKPLIVYHLEKLASIGVQEVVINVSYLAETIQNTLGDGRTYGLHIQYSVEAPVKETGGGIVQALPLLGDKPFLLISADIWTDYPFENLPFQLQGLGHLVLVDNPAYHPEGDFSLSEDGRLLLPDPALGTLTYGNIAILDPKLFQGCPQNTPFSLGPLLRKACEANLMTGETFQSKWANIGTEQCLNSLEYELSQKPQD